MRPRLELVIMFDVTWLFIIPIIVLGWLISRYFATRNMQQQEKQQQILKDIKYKQVLEKAKKAEREEKIFKASTGHIPSQLSLAKECEVTNPVAAIEWYEKAAAQDNEMAQYALARLYRRDPLDQQAMLKANYWQAFIDVKQKSPESLFHFGLLLIQGKGVEADPTLGIDYIQQAATEEFLPAALFLSDWYVAEETDHYLPQQAFYWRIQAAKHNDLDGLMKTAFCYKVGLGVEKDVDRVKYWLERAAEHDHPEAQYLAGKMYLGACANNAAIAYIWFSMAYAGGYKKARVARDEAAPLIGIESILNVQNIAKEIYKILKKQPVTPHSIITLLDNCYGRKGYRPTLADIESLGETHDDMSDDHETSIKEEIAISMTDANAIETDNSNEKPAMKVDDWTTSWGSSSDMMLQTTSITSDETKK
ncbi:MULTISPECIES: tetratricopeptide repeat protein [unclassified Photobacterium]|uniref:tetratricopeptide repeat protein n=1 Tax=unclassified Photobacterium TaxID=2628852 RepID=UPI000D174253|nr:MULTISPECIES: tetratricopeptide repeat protein [unclassified Photobacterium]PSV27211.1 sel1 repeat family protein [Photobacterium sp. GB-72]PSV34432.1 sel1 repeat family protein [Photobacterium sp. GB-210]PSV50980.1 sel1 repeat family protein [Photobacterium sp. GB-1]